MTSTHGGIQKMPEGLDVIVVDDDPDVCELVSTTIKRFYTWGKVLSFTDSEEATNYCLGRDIGVAIFVVDVFLGGASGFYFLDAIDKKCPTANKRFNVSLNFSIF